jgi:AcrR family transcriptional regulator
VSSPAPRWSRLDRDERRAAILATARRLFSQRHYSAVSTAEIARAAGVTRGLVNHYFGTKRELYLEVVRGLVRPLSIPAGPRDTARPMEEVVARWVGRWLDALEENRAALLAAVGAEGFGRDRELERIVQRSRDATVERIIEILGLEPAGHGDQLRAVLRTYSGLVQLATVEWLQRRTLSRDQVEALLSSSLVAMIRDVVPSVAAVPSRSGPGPRRTLSGPAP